MNGFNGTPVSRDTHSSAAKCREEKIESEWVYASAGASAASAAAAAAAASAAALAASASD